jgi:cell division protein FtsX
MTMDFAALIAIVATLSGIALGWLGRARTVKKDVADDTGTVVTLQNNVDYIRRGVDDIRLDQKMQGQQIAILSERVTRVEESNKSMHKRLDKIEE